MKLEVDLNDRKQLVGLESELVNALEVVRSALKAHLNINAPAARPAVDVEQSIRAIITALPDSFNSSAIYEPMLASDIPRETIKAAIIRLVESNLVRVKTPGKGRRPTIYEKVSQ